MPVKWRVCDKINKQSAVAWETKSVPQGRPPLQVQYCERCGAPGAGCLLPPSLIFSFKPLPLPLAAPPPPEPAPLPVASPPRLLRVEWSFLGPVRGRFGALPPPKAAVVLTRPFRAPLSSSGLVLWGCCWRPLGWGEPWPAQHR